MKNRGNVHRKLFRLTPLAVGVCTLFGAGAANAVSLTTPNGDWTFSVNGNINADLVYTRCAKNPGPGGGLLCGGHSGGTAGDRGTANVNTGLLPTALVFGVATTQEGYDLKAVFGFYPGITAHSGSDPNGVGGLNQQAIALETAQIDTRQAFFTVGNKDMGTVEMGRDFGLFGFDAIINDMTIPGLGVEGFMAPAPGNTSLGSIGYGYIYTDTLSQIKYTTPSIGGLTVAAGVYAPLNQVSLSGNSDVTNSSKDTPGFEEQIKYKFSGGGVDGFVSSAGIAQRQTGLSNGGAVNKGSAFAWGLDLTGNVNVGPLGVLLSGYDARGLGTTGLYYDGYDTAGQARRSWGYLAQATYKIIPSLKLGVNYGVSRLGGTAATAGSTIYENSKFTAGAYWSALPNLTLLAEATRAFAKSQDRANDISTTNFNVGAFFSF